MMTGEPCCRHFVCQASGARHHLVSPMRAAGERQNAFLQIDHHQRRVFRIEF
jgi:hypothetical protein